MKIKRVIKPGRPGSKKLVQRYGKNLVCVRYRFDEENQRILKTVELVIDSSPAKEKPTPPPDDQQVYIHIAKDEEQLRTKVKQAGGWWTLELLAWRLPYRTVVKLGLEHRIINEKRMDRANAKYVSHSRASQS